MAALLKVGHSFLPHPSPRSCRLGTPLFQSSREDTTTSSTSTSSSRTLTINEATQILKDWDQHFNRENISGNSLPDEIEKYREVLPSSIQLLNEEGRKERDKDSTTGRVMLGICASSLEEGIAALKSWVTALSLPRGLLHGADKDGVMLELKGGVYIKYNTGGSMTFSQIRLSGVGLDALWRPGDALLEPYDGNYRGVYFQVELADGEFRQYLLPLNVFEGK